MMHWRQFPAHQITPHRILKGHIIRFISQRLKCYQFCLLFICCYLFICCCTSNWCWSFHLSHNSSLPCIFISFWSPSIPRRVFPLSSLNSKSVFIIKFQSDFQILICIILIKTGTIENESDPKLFFLQQASKLSHTFESVIKKNSKEF